MNEEGRQKDVASKTKGLVWLGAGVFLAAILALGIAPFVRAIPWGLEEKLAEHLPSTPAGKVCEGSPKAQALLKKLIARLYPLDKDDKAFSVSVQIVDNPELNAYAQLGGRITVYSGLLEEVHAPEELAGALAHEIGHVQRRHILEGAMLPLIALVFSTGDASTGAEMAGTFLRMDFSRGQEEEADEAGLLRLQKAHIDNRGFKNLFERMKKSSSVPAFVSDHPSYQSRFERVDSFKNENVKPIMSQKDWLVLQAYCR